MTPRLVHCSLAYWRFAKGYYSKDGKPTKELACMRKALRPLRELYGQYAGERFWPEGIEGGSAHMIKQGFAAEWSTSRISRIKRMFKWAVAEELVPSAVFHGLQAVSWASLWQVWGPRNRADPTDRRPLCRHHPALRYASCGGNDQAPATDAACGLGNLSSCGRPTSTPAEKSGSTSRSTIRAAGGGIESKFPLGPEAQKILTPFLGRDPQAFIFSPLESEKWRLEHRPPYHGKERKTKIYPSELRQREILKAARRKQRKPKRPKGNRYDTNSYRRAIEYGFKQAKKAGFVTPHWHPHQLRHNRGTEVRKKYGIEAAQVALGHAKADATEIYAEKNLEQARQIAQGDGVNAIPSSVAKRRSRWWPRLGSKTIRIER